MKPVIKSKRSLGQNFFVNRTLATQISGSVLEIIKTNSATHLYEVGPGRGAFTDIFLSTIEPSTKYILIEKDTELTILLQDKYKEFNNIEIYNTDILKYIHNYSNDINRIDSAVWFGSLPYNISKDIIIDWICKLKHKSFSIIIQEEVAQLIMNSRDSTAFGIFVQSFCHIKAGNKISPGSFSPPPKVNSRFITLSRIDNPKITHERMQDYFLFLKRLFIGKNKKLKVKVNKIKSSYLDKRVRHLSVADFQSIYLEQEISYF